MIKYVLFLVIISVWLISFYVHFIMMMSPTLMIGFKGSGHVRDFQRQYATHGADLWIFDQANRKGPQLNYGQHPFLIFRRSNYAKMLLVEHLIPKAPYQTNLRHVVEFRSDNMTLATLWPRLGQWPPTHEKEPLKWFRDHGGHVVTIIV